MSHNLKNLKKHENQIRIRLIWDEWKFRFLFKCKKLVLVNGMLGVQLHINHESLPKKRKICPSAKHEDQI